MATLYPQQSVYLLAICTFLAFLPVTVVRLCDDFDSEYGCVPSYLPEKCFAIFKRFFKDLGTYIVD